MPSSDRETLPLDLKARLDAMRARFMPDARLGVWEVEVFWRDGVLRAEGETTLPAACWPELGAVMAIETLRPEPARVNAPVLNLRREPRHGAELVSQAPLGTPLHVLKRPPGEWWRVQTPDGYVAWARSENIRLAPPSPEGLRTLPIVLEAQLDDGKGTLPLAAGSELRVRDRRDDHWLAELPDGVVLRIPTDTAVIASERPACWPPHAALGLQVVAIAQKWLGIPYLWGGKSGWGLDCSGLTQLAYEILGIRLPRDADQQAKALPAVPSWEDLAPGDLLFYPGHVALWAGDGAVIHASSPRGSVVREELSHTPWLRERCHGMGRPVLPL
jgi:hypothetical protein